MKRVTLSLRNKTFGLFILKVSHILPVSENVIQRSDITLGHSVIYIILQLFSKINGSFDQTTLDFSTDKNKASLTNPHLSLLVINLLTVTHAVITHCYQNEASLFKLI